MKKYKILILTLFLVLLPFTANAISFSRAKCFVDRNVIILQKGGYIKIGKVIKVLKVKKNYVFRENILILLYNNGTGETIKCEDIVNIEEIN